MNSKNISDNKRFWHTVKPLSSDKSIGKETIILVDKDEIFQDELVVAKLVDFLLSFKAGDRTYIGDYRPVGILPALSKIFEHILLKQMENFVESILSKFQCGIRKGFSAQHCLLVMIEKMNVY